MSDHESSTLKPLQREKRREEREKKDKERARR